MAKVNGNYFKPGEFHVCRFCGDTIQKKFTLEDGTKRLLPLGNYSMWFLELDNGIKMSVNSCKDCRDYFDASDAKLVEATLLSNIEQFNNLGEVCTRKSLYGKADVKVKPNSKGSHAPEKGFSGRVK